MRTAKSKKVNRRLLKNVVEKILDRVNPAKIILFGSWAYGLPQAGSDLDILVIVNNNIKSKYDLTTKLYTALFDVDVAKDIVVASSAQVKDWENVPQAFLTKIVNKGKLLYERKV